MWKWSHCLLLLLTIGIVVRNTLVTYDREHLKVGFWKTNCSELWEKLRVSDTSPAPAPAPSSGEISIPATSPAPPPIGVPSYVISGMFIF